MMCTLRNKEFRHQFPYHVYMIYAHSHLIHASMLTFVPFGASFSQCKLVSGWRLRKRRSAPPYGPCGSGRTLLYLLLPPQQSPLTTATTTNFRSYSRSDGGRKRNPLRITVAAFVTGLNCPSSRPTNSIINWRIGGISDLENICFWLACWKSTRCTYCKVAINADRLRPLLTEHEVVPALLLKITDKMQNGFTYWLQQLGVSNHLLTALTKYKHVILINGTIITYSLVCNVAVVTAVYDMPSSAVSIIQT